MTPSRVFQPRYEGEFPSLGDHIVEWMEHYLLHPTQPERSLRLTPEQKTFIYNLFRTTSDGKRLVYRRGILQRPKGWGKSPIAGGFLLAFCLADAVPAGLDAAGRPVGRPRTSLDTVVGGIAGVSEAQTGNAFKPLLRMISEDLQDDYVCIPKDTAVHLENRGIIEPLTSSGRTVEGAPTNVVVCDQTESWTSTNLMKFHAAILRNVAKNNGTVIEIPNAMEITGGGEGSVAERTITTITKLKRSGIPLIESGILYDSRTPSEKVDLADDESVYMALLEVYGDSAIERGGWVDLDRLVRERYDDANGEDEFRRFFLNQSTSATADAYMTPDEVDGSMTMETIPLGSRIMLGFDGSTGRPGDPGVLADATALVAMSVDGDRPLIEKIGLWAEDEPGSGWTAPLDEIEDAIEKVFKDYSVIGFFGDPSMGYGTMLDRIAGKYGRRLRVKAGRDPIAFYPSSGTSQAIISEALPLMAQDLISGRVAMAKDHDLRAHFINARRRETKYGWGIYKSSPKSPHKIDLTYAALMAYIAHRRWTASGGAPRDVTTSSRPKKRRVRTLVY